MHAHPQFPAGRSREGAGHEDTEAIAPARNERRLRGGRLQPGGAASEGTSSGGVGCHHDVPVAGGRCAPGAAPFDTCNKLALPRTWLQRWPIFRMRGEGVAPPGEGRRGRSILEKSLLRFLLQFPKGSWEDSNPGLFGLPSLGRVEGALRLDPRVVMVVGMEVLGWRAGTQHSSRV